MILALRALGLGDLLTVVPALRALKRRYREHELVLAAPEPLEPLVRRIGAADRLLTVPSAVEGPPDRFDAPRPDIAVNLHGEGPQSTVALRALNPGQLWSYGVPGAPAWYEEEHEVARWCRLVNAYGCEADRGDLYLDTTSPKQGPVVIHPGAAQPERRWPAGRYATVARCLAWYGYDVVVTAGPGELELAQKVAEEAGLSPDSVRHGLDLDELAELIAYSRLVICPDTGVAHLATAVRTPSIVLFGPQPPSRWGPPTDPRHRALWNGSELLAIEAERVLAEAAQLLTALPLTAGRT